MCVGKGTQEASVCGVEEGEGTVGACGEDERGGERVLLRQRKGVVMHPDMCENFLRSH